MKNIKIYENFIKEFDIDLLTLCEYTNGDMVIAVNILKKLQDESTDYFFYYKDNKYKRKISHFTTGGKDMLFFSGTAVSYKFLSENPNNNIYFTFYNVNVSDELLALKNMNKYNL